MCGLRGIEPPRAKTVLGSELAPRSVEQHLSGTMVRREPRVRSGSARWLVRFTGRPLHLLPMTCATPPCTLTYPPPVTTDRYVSSAPPEFEDSTRFLGTGSSDFDHLRPSRPKKHKHTTPARSLTIPCLDRYLARHGPGHDTASELRRQGSRVSASWRRTSGTAGDILRRHIGRRNRKSA